MRKHSEVILKNSNFEKIENFSLCQNQSKNTQQMSFMKAKQMPEKITLKKIAFYFENISIEAMTFCYVLMLRNKISISLYLIH